jgi:peptidoglycan/LPS O-acetylase OafA/YrhL
VRAGDEYIRHIDGLRTLSVLSVIIFHLDHTWLPGGFVAVDVFFVISGFLITQIIIRQSREGRFSFGSFYLRRVRRIMPAFLAMLALTFAFGAFVFSPERLQSLGASTTAAALLVPNMHFWSLSGYFDTASLEKPLLHTWTLGVEEQFYLLWPAFIMLFARSRTALILAIGGTLVASYAACFLLNDTVGPSTTFYLMPFRMYEFAGGAACIALRAWRPPRWLATLFTAAGLAMIAYAMPNFSEHTPPWLGGAVTTSAVMLLISFTDRSWGLAPILDNPFTAFIGAISYSLYMVHWPIEVFYAYLKFEPLTTVEKLLCALIIGVCALALYYAVERPFHRTLFKQDWRPLVAIVAGVFGFIVAISAWAWADGGWPWRFSERAQKLFTYQRVPPPPGCAIELYQGPGAFDRAACIAPRDDATNVLLYGDSTADHLKSTLEAMFPQLNIMQASAAGCLPLRGYGRQLSRGCERFNRFIYRDIIDRRAAQYVMLTGNWTLQSAPRVRASLASIRAAGAIPILVGPPPIYTQVAPEIAFRGRDLAPAQFQRFASRFSAPQTAGVNERLRGLAAELGVPYIDLYQSACPHPRQCRVLTRGGVPIAVDRAHPTREGSLELLGDARARGDLAVFVPR